MGCRERPGRDRCVTQLAIYRYRLVSACTYAAIITLFTRTATRMAVRLPRNGTFRSSAYRGPETKYEARAAPRPILHPDVTAMQRLDTWKLEYPSEFELSESWK